MKCTKVAVGADPSQHDVSLTALSRWAIFKIFYISRLNPGAAVSTWDTGVFIFSCLSILLAKESHVLLKTLLPQIRNCRALD